RRPAAGARGPDHRRRDAGDRRARRPHRVAVRGRRVRGVDRARARLDEPDRTHCAGGEAHVGLRAMRMYDSFGPNPRALRMFLREKGVELPKIDVDLLGAENRRPPYTDKNPGGQLPALETDDGRVIGETVAIFEYLEEKHPTPPLVGRT